MSNLSLWVVNQKRFEFVVDTIEGVTLNLIALTDDLIQTVKMNDNSNDMILACADYGVSNGDTRFSDDDKLAAYLADAWGSAEFMIDCDPSLKHQVGERVAEISGILDFVNDKIEAEELAVLQAEEDEIKSNVVDGDDLGNTDITLGQLHEDNTAATQLN